MKMAQCDSKSSCDQIKIHKHYIKRTTMYFILIATIFGITSAGSLPSRSYLRPNPDLIIQTQQQKPYFLEDTGNRRANQEQEKNAAILKLTQDINDNGFHYSYETSNGIRAEETSNSVQTQGGFSYVGDDGNTYAITYTSGVDGFRAQGDHLPVAPPTPEAILLALRQNEFDEAVGIFNDGLYRSDAEDNQLKKSQSSKSSFSLKYDRQRFNPKTGYVY